MPTPTNIKKITQLNCSMGKCKSTVTKIQNTTAAPATISTSTQEHEQQAYQSARTKTAKRSIKEVILPPLTSVSTKQIVRGWLYTILGKDVENLQTITFRTAKAQSSLPPLQQSSSTTTSVAVATKTAKRATSFLPISATTAKSCRKQCLSIKMPLRHLILTIMTLVVFSMEFTISNSTLLQQQMTTKPPSNTTHLSTATTSKSTKINENLQNLPVTSTTIKSRAENSLIFLSSLSSPPSLPVTTYARPVLQSIESAALVKKSPPTSSLTTSTLDDSSSNRHPFLTGTATLMHTEAPAHSSFQWDDDDQEGYSELSLSTSILNTYDASDLPPLSEAEQAAKDLLTKGFSIPTYLPPFPVFAVADLPAYLNTVSTTTTEAPISRIRPSDGYGTYSQENLLYFDNLPEHQLLGHHQNHHKLLMPKRNSSMASSNVTVQVGNHAYLPCHIHRLQNKPVSWVRQRDGHIISVDQTTFIADQRFQAIFQNDKEFTWSLQIKYVQQTDEGWYECQASSEPKLCAKVYLKVIVPLTELIGDQSRFVKAGSKVALHCIVRGTLDPPQYIIWYHDKFQIGENNIMGWYTQLDRNIFGNSGDNQNTIGSLIIPFVRKLDSGNYTCQPSNSASVSVDLHVLSGEYSASAIMSAARTYTINGYYLLLFLFILIFLHKT